jgi:hypothetical protein
MFSGIMKYKKRKMPVSTRLHIYFIHQELFKENDDRFEEE